MILANSIKWSEWQALNGAWLDDRLPTRAGLYRIRRIGFNGVDYIGQTGTGSMTLKKRMGMLRGVWKHEMPYRDPHTVGPALWALRHRDCADFEVSVAVIQEDTPNRKSLEALAISLYRQQNGCSPTLNFGRMPPGYIMSSGNNSRLVAAGKRFRGGPSNKQTHSHLPSIAPLGTLDDDINSPTWCGFAWSDWQTLPHLSTSINRTDTGLYRIKPIGQLGLLYVGEGKIIDRLRAHMKKTTKLDHPQGELFRDQGPLLYSCVVNNEWKKHQRLELENDLIAAHIIQLARRPMAQFLG